MTFAYALAFFAVHGFPRRLRNTVRVRSHADFRARYPASRVQGPEKAPHRDGMCLPTLLSKIAFQESALNTEPLGQPEINVPNMNVSLATSHVFRTDWTCLVRRSSEYHGETESSVGTTPRELIALV